MLGATDKLRATVEAMLAGGSAAEFARTQALAEAALMNQGVTFSVYSDARGVEKIFPVCLLPRVISAAEWERLERGLKQRVVALEAFVADVYSEQRILSVSTIPAEVVLGSAQCFPALRGVGPPAGASTSRASTSSATEGSGCWRTTSALRPASRTCWRTGFSQATAGRAFEAARSGR
jgi:uncharacterized circularly permuted ATP-grasp superfamily protein